jgi:hypothetical protein
MERLIRIIEEPLKLLGRFEVQCVIIGGVASTLYGSALLTNDLDLCYARNIGNLEKLATALRSVNARLRNAPPDLPFLLDAGTLKRGLNFTFTTAVGSIDLLGEVSGIGAYEDMVAHAVTYELLGYLFPVIEIKQLILAKRTAGRPKDLIAVAELEALLEQQTKLNES